MPDIDNMRLRRLDLTVLLVFLGLMRHRKATAAAAELGLTQSAVSHSLKRLREVFGDELFLRRPHGLEPTAVAVALERPVRSAVEQLSAALEGPPAFEPARAAGILRIGAFDSELATLIPGLIRVIEEKAPGLRISARTIGRKPALDALAAGELDLAVGYFWEVGADFVTTPLYDERYLVVGRADDPTMTPPLTLERYLAARHLVVSPAGDLSGIVDRILARDGLARRVVASVPLFFPAFAAVAGTGCIATMPRGLARAYAGAFGLSCAEPPIAIRHFVVSAVRHRREARSPMHGWLVERAREICAPGRAPSGPA